MKKTTRKRTKETSAVQPRELIIASFLMLFLELALIRWAGSNIIYLSYFTNFVLLGSFLGVGLGFLRARAKVDLFPLAPAVLTAFVAFVLLSQIQIDRSGSNAIYFGGFTKSGLPAWVALPVIFLAVTTVMTLVSEGVGRRFVAFKPLMAYRLDIIGSVLGVALFSILAFLHMPSIVWGVVVAVAFFSLVSKKKRDALLFAPLIALIIMLGIESLGNNTYWSPYYKITLTSVPNPAGKEIDILVNGIPHQAIESSAVRQKSEPLYFRAYDRLKNPKLDNVLIVGAGNGTDVAIALSKGAKHVDAVEIDPTLYQLGKKLQPERPYDDPRVTVHINDGRAFLEQTKETYDLILFALPDSLTLISSQSSLRLESFLFTEEAMQTTRDRLRPGGVFGMYNYYREQWLADRLANTLQQTYGQAPCIDEEGTFGHLALLMASKDPNALQCKAQWQPGNREIPKPATDDWPFLYLRSRSIPLIYLATILLISLATYAAVRLVAGSPRRMRPYADLFFMGAAFFLLETKSVVQFALMFGTTWFVNALVFLGILLAVLAAVELTPKLSRKRHVLLIARVILFGSLAISWLVPSSYLLQFQTPVRFALAVVLTFTPVLAANFIFAQRFQHTKDATMAFGANLLGAILGGLIEYSSLVIGYRSLILVVMLLYGISIVAMPSGRIRAKTS